MIKLNKFFLLLMVLFSWLAVEGQDLREIDSREYRTKAVLTSGELLVFNDYSTDISVRVSYDKKIWNSKKVESKRVYVLTLPRDISHLYLQLCQKSSETLSADCDIYKIPPKKRYVIRYNIQMNKLEVGKAE
jgi:hypothetical protein